MMRPEDGLIARLETLATFLDASGLAYEFHVANEAATTIQRLLDQTEADHAELFRLDVLLAEARQDHGDGSASWTDHGNDQ